jgi:pyruvate,water dikinase
LLLVLRRSRQFLVALHGHEVLAGFMLGEGDAGATAASLALRRLTLLRAEGFEDDDAVAADPHVLALVPPSISRSAPLPEGPIVLPEGVGTEQALPLREALRLRARWVQELTARVASHLGERLVSSGVLESDRDVARLRWNELEDAVMRRPAEVVPNVEKSGPPLPAAFRLTESGNVFPVSISSDWVGRGAGGGRGVGTVHHGSSPNPGDVLVVRTLDPDLAPVLPHLAGLVAETGSVLSHLAIVAREFGIPTVVAFPNALERFSDGARVVVDGVSGEVAMIEEGRP